MYEEMLKTVAQAAYATMITLDALRPEGFRERIKVTVEGALKDLDNVSKLYEGQLPPHLCGNLVNFLRSTEERVLQESGNMYMVRLTVTHMGTNLRTVEYSGKVKSEVLKAVETVVVEDFGIDAITKDSLMSTLKTMKVNEKTTLIPHKAPTHRLLCEYLETESKSAYPEP